MEGERYALLGWKPTLPVPHPDFEGPWPQVCKWGEVLQGFEPAFFVDLQLFQGGKFENLGATRSKWREVVRECIIICWLSRIASRHSSYMITYLYYRLWPWWLHLFYVWENWGSVRFSWWKPGLFLLSNTPHPSTRLAGGRAGPSGHNTNRHTIPCSLNLPLSWRLVLSWSCVNIISIPTAQRKGAFIRDCRICGWIISADVRD